MLEEIFQEIPIHGRVTKYLQEKYLISSHGNVFSKDRGKIMILPIDKDGYRRINLVTAPYEKKHFMVHHLVMLSFNDLPTKKKNEVNHKDKNRDNNFAYNLEWCTRRFNMRHKNKRKLDLKIKEAVDELSKAALVYMKKQRRE